MESPAESRRIVRFAEFELDLRAGELRTNGHHIILAEKPFQILAALLDRPGEMVTRDELAKRLWPAGTFVDFNLGLNKAVNRLREALDDSPEEPRFIETFPKRGYRFIAAISPQNGAESIVIPAPAAITAGAPAEAATAVLNPIRMKYLAWISIAGVVLFVAFGAKYWSRRNNELNFQKMEISRLTNSGKAEHVAISADGRYVAYAKREREGVRLWMRQVATHSDVQILGPSAMEFQGLSFSPDGNYVYFVRPIESDPGLKNLYMVPALGGPARLLIHDIDSSVSFSPDGRQFVFTRGIPTRNFTEVRIANADGTSDRLLANLPESFAGYQPGATWSPDGKTIAVSVMRLGRKTGFALDTVSLPDGTVRELQTSPYGIGRALWLPQGDTLLVPFHDQGERGQLWVVPLPVGHPSRLTNDLTNYSMAGFDSTRDGKTVVALEWASSANIWEAPARYLSDARQISSSELPLLEVSELPNGKLLGLDSQGQLWSLNYDGRDRKPFVSGKHFDSGVSCGDFVFFNSFEGGHANLLRADEDGTNLTTLATSGDFSIPTCAPNGDAVYYVDMQSPQKIMRISSRGGTAVEVARIPGDGVCGSLTVSSDGRFLAYPYEEFSPNPLIRLAVISSEGGQAITELAAPGGVYSFGQLHWSPDNKTLQYVLIRGGVSNIWEQPITGGQPRQVTHFQSDLIFSFRWSRDNERLLFTRGELAGDIVLLTNLR